MSTKPLDTNTLLFNGAGVLLGVFLVGYVLKSAVTTEHQPPCSTRYPAATLLPFESEPGAPFSPIELQARFGITEQNVLENMEAVAGSGGAAHTVLDVKLGRAAFKNNPAPKGGASFQWRPIGMEQPIAACLSYSYFLQDGFDFSKTGGILPGLYGAEQTTEDGQRADKWKFATRVVWHEDSVGGVFVDNPSGPEIDPLTVIDPGHYQVQSGRWVAIEQEVVLNTPGQSDGVIRLYVDGELKVENSAATLRDSDTIKLKGVLADVNFAGAAGWSGPPRVDADVSVRFSTFEVRWIDRAEPATQ